MTCAAIVPWLVLTGLTAGALAAPEPARDDRPADEGGPIERLSPPRLTVEVVAYEGPVEGPNMSTAMMVHEVAPPVRLDEDITSIEVVHTELRPLGGPREGGPPGEREAYFHFVLVHLNADGFAKLLKARDAAAQAEDREVLVGVGTRSPATAHLDLDPDEKTASVRLVIYQEQLLELSRAVRQDWNDDPGGSSTVNEWMEGKVPPPRAPR